MPIGYYDGNSNWLYDGNSISTFFSNNETRCLLCVFGRQLDDIFKALLTSKVFQL